MEVIFLPGGRLGNAIFRYLACSILSIKYGYQYKNFSSESFNINNYKHVSEEEIKSILLNKKIDLPPKIVLREYYQHDYIQFKKEILDYIEKNKNLHTITTDENNTYFLKDLIDTPVNFNKYYDIVIHVRLGDFIANTFPFRVIINLEYYYKLFNTLDLKNKKIVLIGDNIKNVFEKNYIEQLINYFTVNNLNIVYENNDILTDFHIIKNAEIVVCCMSTFSWSAVLLSNKVKTCYLPDYPIIDKNNWLSMKKPCYNTLYYKFY
jgi:hypothetical protein